MLCTRQPHKPHLKGKPIMPEVSSVDAGRIIYKSHETIRRHVNSGKLVARREGPRGTIWVDIEELRKFAVEYRYRFNEELVAQITKT